MGPINVSLCRVFFLYFLGLNPRGVALSTFPFEDFMRRLCSFSFFLYRINCSLDIWFFRVRGNPVFMPRDTSSLIRRIVRFTVHSRAFGGCVSTPTRQGEIESLVAHTFMLLGDAHKKEEPVATYPFVHVQCLFCEILQAHPKEFLCW